MKAELKFLKEKLEAVEEDRGWLERQLKQAKKANKLMRAELESRMRLGDGSGDPGTQMLALGYTDGGGSGAGGMFPPPQRPSSNAGRHSPGGRYVAQLQSRVVPPVPLGPAGLVWLSWNAATSLAAVQWSLSPSLPLSSPLSLSYKHDGNLV